MDQFIEYLFKRNNVKNTVLDSIYWLLFVKKMWKLAFLILLCTSFFIFEFYDTQSVL